MSRRILTDDGWVVQEPEQAQQEQAEAPGKDKQTIKELKKKLKEAEEKALQYGSELGRLEKFIREKYPNEILLMPEDVVDVAIKHLIGNDEAESKGKE